MSQDRVVITYWTYNIILYLIMEDDDSFGSPKQVTDEDIRKTLQRVEQNDATLKTLYIGSNHESPTFDGHHIVSANINNDGVYNNLSVVDDELSRLGDYIGTNTNLNRAFRIDDPFFYCMIKHRPVIIGIAVAVSVSMGIKMH